MSTTQDVFAALWRASEELSTLPDPDVADCYGPLDNALLRKAWKARFEVDGVLEALSAATCDDEDDVEAVR